MAASGIAITATILQRQRQVIGTRLGEHISVTDPTTQAVFTQMMNGFIAAGSDTVTATTQALMAMRGLLLREASMVSFVMLFRLLGVVFLLMIPLVFIMRRPKGRVAPVDAH